MINLERLGEYPIVAPDVEATGLDWSRKDRMFGIALAVWDGVKVESQYWDVRNKPRIIEALKRELPKCKKLVNHGAKFDAHMLGKDGIRVPLDRFECTMVRAALINEWETPSGKGGFDLDYQARKHLGRGKPEGIYEELAAMFGGKPTRQAQMPNLHRAPERLAAKYAAPDPELAILLWMWQEEQIKKQELERVWRLEQRLLPMLVDIEEFGIRVDEDLARKQLLVIQVKIDEAQGYLNKVAGRQVNANSSPQMRALFKVMKKNDGNRDLWYTDSGFLLESTDGGEASLGKKSLQVMADLGDERAGAVNNLRKLIKATQFLKDHILGHAIDGRVHPNYNQTRGENDLGTGTGRLSIDDPAMQQIPARDKDIAALVRPCFIPEKGHNWGCSDWEQFEFRWFAHYTKDADINEAYRQDKTTDFHGIVSKITGIPRNAPYAGAANAKQINLGLVFGMGKGELCYQMGMPYTTRYDKVRQREWKIAGPEGEAVFDKYHSAIPGVKNHLEQAASIARARGFIRTLGDRHIRFPHGGHHKAGGLVLQGTAADCIKIKMLELWELGKKEGFKYLLPVHDENNTSLPTKEVKQLVPKITKILQAFGEGDEITCRIPILASTKVGANWHEASKK